MTEKHSFGIPLKDVRPMTDEERQRATEKKETNDDRARNTKNVQKSGKKVQKQARIR